MLRSGTIYIIGNKMYVTVNESMIHVLNMSRCGPIGRPIAYKKTKIQWWLTHVSPSDILHFGMCCMSCNECLMDGSNPLEKLHCGASQVQLQDTCLCGNVL